HGAQRRQGRSSGGDESGGRAAHRLHHSGRRRSHPVGRTLALLERPLPNLPDNGDALRARFRPVPLHRPLIRVPPLLRPPPPPAPPSPSWPPGVTTRGPSM